MKTTLTIVLSILSFCAFAQAPQGFTYQAVATNNNGFELVEQNISVRVSILSESSTGVEQWIETHSTTTDGFGLFTITIGQGTSTGSGVQSSFSEIDWGASEHHLKIEMDVDGGSDYQLLGISQLMSVPYALYAESSGTPGPEGPEGPPGEPAAPVDYDSLATIISADSSFTANFSGGSGNFGSIGLVTSEDLCLNVQTVIQLPDNDDYTSIGTILIDDESNIYISSYGDSEIILSKFDENSNLLWSKSIPNINIEQIELNNNNNIIISGSSNGSGMQSITIDGITVTGHGYFIDINAVTGNCNWIYAQVIGCSSYPDRKFVLDDNYLYFLLKSCTTQNYETIKIAKVDLSTGLLNSTSDGGLNNIQKLGIYDNKIIGTCYCYAWPSYYNRAYIFDANTLQQIGDEIPILDTYTRDIVSDSTGAYLFIGDQSGVSILKFDGTSITHAGDIPHETLTSHSSTNIEIMSIYGVNQVTFNNSVHATGYGAGSAFIGNYHFDPDNVTNPYNLTVLSTLSINQFSASQNGKRVVMFYTFQSICINNVFYPGDEYYIIIL